MRRHVPGGAAPRQALPGGLELEWFDLRKKALQQLEQGICAVDATHKELQTWDATVLRFRKLREALTAADTPPSMRCEVYELSAVVCAAARNMAELLKCLQQLVNNMYPAVQAAAQPATVTQETAQPAMQAISQRQQQQGLPPVVAKDLELDYQQQQGPQQQPWQQSPHQMVLYSTSDRSSSCYRTALIRSVDHYAHSSCGSAAAAAVQVQRHAEVAAALLLYFVCVPQQPIMQELVKQLKAAAHCCLGPSSSSSSSSSTHICTDAQPEPMLLLQHPTYQLALQAASAFLNCQWVQFMQCYKQDPPMLMQVVLESALPRLRLHTVHSVVAAYRMLPSCVLARWLGLPTDQQQWQQQQQKAAAESSRELEDATRQQLVGALVLAGGRGCKGARLAAEQCMISGAALPDTLQFRG